MQLILALLLLTKAAAAAGPQLAVSNHTHFGPRPSLVRGSGSGLSSQSQPEHSEPSNGTHADAAANTTAWMETHRAADVAGPMPPPKSKDVAVCGPGEFVNATHVGANNTCPPCPPGTYMDQARPHREVGCRPHAVCGQGQVLLAATGTAAGKCFTNFRKGTGYAPQAPERKPTSTLRHSQSPLAQSWFRVMCVNGTAVHLADHGGHRGEFEDPDQEQSLAGDAAYVDDPPLFIILVFNPALFVCCCCTFCFVRRSCCWAWAPAWGWRGCDWDSFWSHEIGEDGVNIAIAAPDVTCPLGRTLGLGIIILLKMIFEVLFAIDAAAVGHCYEHAASYFDYDTYVWVLFFFLIVSFLMAFVDYYNSATWGMTGSIADLRFSVVSFATHTNHAPRTCPLIVVITLASAPACTAHMFPPCACGANATRCDSEGSRKTTHDELDTRTWNSTRPQ